MLEEEPNLEEKSFITSQQGCIYISQQEELTTLGKGIFSIEQEEESTTRKEESLVEEGEGRGVVNDEAEEQLEEDSGELPPVISTMSFFAVNAALVTSQLLFGGFHGE
jgi:hypothetical protein